MRGVVATLSVAVVLTGAAACGLKPAAPARLPEVNPDWQSCAAAMPDRPENIADALELPLLTDDFAASSAVLCTAEPRRRADGGEDLVEIESTADDITDLVAALRLPEVPRGYGACTMEIQIVPWFALLDARGRWVRPGVPTGVCGKPRSEVREALTALDLTQVGTRVLREMESGAAVASGCSQQWADMVWVETTDAGREWGKSTVDVSPFGSEVRLCVYRVPASEQRSGKPAGEFEHGEILSKRRWTQLASALKASGPAAECSTPAGGFALLRRADGNQGEIYVELDGCRRVIVAPLEGPTVLAQADDELIDLILPT